MSTTLCSEDTGSPGGLPRGPPPYCVVVRRYVRAIRVPASCVPYVPEALQRHKAAWMLPACSREGAGGAKHAVRYAY